MPVGREMRGCLVLLLFSCYMLDVEAYTSPAEMARLEQEAVLNQQRIDLTRAHQEQHRSWSQMASQHHDLGDSEAMDQ